MSRAHLDALGLTRWQSRTAPAPALDLSEPADTDRSDTLPDNWNLLRQDVRRCTRCRLHETRVQPVFGVGDDRAKLMIIGEAPGAEEDRTGEPFVGRAGQLLNGMLKAINIEREQVFIANVIKCRPPQNRDPRRDESEQCEDYLSRQLTLLQPRLVLAVGRIAAQQLLGSDLPLGKLRNQIYQLETYDIPLVVTYHPAYLLRSPSQKRLAWQDLKRVRAILEQAA